MFHGRLGLALYERVESGFHGRLAPEHHRRPDLWILRSELTSLQNTAFPGFGPFGSVAAIGSCGHRNAVIGCFVAETQRKNGNCALMMSQETSAENRLRVEHQSRIQHTRKSTEMLSTNMFLYLLKPSWTSLRFRLCWDQDLGLQHRSVCFLRPLSSLSPQTRTLRPC